MKNINDLRNVLFETMESVKNGELSIEKAKQIAEIGQVIVNSAKVEVAYADTGANVASGFLDVTPELPNGVVGVTKHICR